MVSFLEYVRIGSTLMVGIPIFYIFILVLKKYLALYPASSKLDAPLRIKTIARSNLFILISLFGAFLSCFAAFILFYYTSFSESSKIGSIFFVIASAAGLLQIVGLSGVISTITFDIKYFYGTFSYWLAYTIISILTYSKTKVGTDYKSGVEVYQVTGLLFFGAVCVFCALFSIIMVGKYKHSEGIAKKEALALGMYTGTLFIGYFIFIIAITILVSVIASIIPWIVFGAVVYFLYMYAKTTTNALFEQEALISYMKKI